MSPAYEMVCHCWRTESSPVAAVIEEETEIEGKEEGDYSFGVKVRSLVDATAQHQPFSVDVCASDQK